jgi:hypothetical protein
MLLAAPAERLAANCRRLFTSPPIRLGEPGLISEKPRMRFNHTASLRYGSDARGYGHGIRYLK